jgi:hypothetical protein
VTAQVGPPGQCRSCPARFQWAQTEARGRRSPIDAEPSPQGTMRLRARGGGLLPLASVLKGVELDEARAAGENLYQSHFVTCPGRDRHRRPR